MKKYVAAILTFVMVLCCFTGCSAKEEVNSSAKQEESSSEAKGNVIKLGNSGLTVTTEKEYKKGEITSEDTDENQVAYYQSEETKVDFDVYEWAKASDETLEAAAKEEADEYDATVEMKEINGFSVAVYNAKEESEGQEYDTATYMIDNGDYFVEIVFWLDGENAAAEVEAILATLTK